MGYTRPLRFFVLVGHCVVPNKGNLNHVALVRNNPFHMLILLVLIESLCLIYLYYLSDKKNKTGLVQISQGSLGGSS